jgi:putative hydroxymethylpyrimidine transporter CytX
MIGIQNLGRVNTVAMASLFVLTVILCFVIFGKGTMMNTGGDGITFGAAVELSVAMPLSWLPLISDYTREAEGPVKATAASAVTYGIVSCFMYVIGMGAAIFTGETDIAAIMVKAGLGIAGLLIIVFSTVTTTFLDAWSAGVSSETISPKISGKWAAVAATVIGTAGAVLLPLENITDFLYFIGSVFAPMIAIQTADFFLLKKSREKEAFSVRNLVIWAIGFTVYRLLMKVDIIVGNTLPDMAVTMALCVLADRFLKEN